ncbi:AP-1 complex subunit mu-2-like [Olea europaea subsp. europaea]|uniref:AP-1 complex subunit mu-2-like n=1 Tax=Olea europaea subsp. europaea TaxID=158383 RepID=A0A8S0UTF5_OLEEU|nr:AP-1 complex subunit mu-2-like [Olea europaea subsp. europaea]
MLGSTYNTQKRVLVWRDYRGDFSAVQAERFFTKLIEKEGDPETQDPVTEAKSLSEFIKTDAYRMEVSQRPPMAVTNAVSWRSEGIRYKKNEVFPDVVESVLLLVTSNGQIIRLDVVGALKMLMYLRFVLPPYMASHHVLF